jgi:hypothetical protein
MIWCCARRKKGGLPLIGLFFFQLIIGFVTIAVCKGGCLYVDCPNAIIEYFLCLITLYAYCIYIRRRAAEAYGDDNGEDDDFKDRS